MDSSLVSFIFAGYTISLYSLILGFIWIVYLWETYLSYRQNKLAVRTTTLPDEFRSITTEANYEKSRLYAIDKHTFSFYEGLYNMVQLTLFFHYSVIGNVWYWMMNHIVYLSNTLNEYTGFDLAITKEHELTCMIFFITYFSIFTFFDSLPWSMYRTFVLEDRHGFNNQTVSFFIKDSIKKLVLSLLIGLPITVVLVIIMQRGGEYFYIYAYLFALVATLCIMFIYPEFIAPIFDKYESLPQGELRTKIEKLASSIDFPLQKLLVVEGSKRSSHSNAYFFGFGKNKRIVLFDTLIKGFVFPSSKDGTTSESAAKSIDKGCADNEEIVAVLAHELGHWKLGHVLMHLVIAQVNLFLMFVVFGALVNIETIYTVFGFAPGTTPTFLRLTIIFQFIFSPYNTLLDFIMTLITRKLEFQADHFAVDLGYPEKLKAALVVLNEDNLSFPVNDWLFSLFHFSHPPVLERMKAIDNAKQKKA